VLGIAIAAGGGYWFGQQRTKGGTAAANATAAVGPGSASGAVTADKGGGAQAVLVEAITASTAPMPQSITAVGSLRSDESVTLRPEVAGRVSAIGFQEGQRVTKGTVLVKLDPAINEAEVQQAKANLTLAKAKYDRAVNRESAYEILTQRRSEAAATTATASAPAAIPAAKQGGDMLHDWLWGTGRRQGMVESMAKQAARTVGSQLGRQILRGVLGGITGKRR